MAQTQTIKSEYYIVKSGDTLSSIALKFKKTLNQIIAWNPQIKNANLIYPNQSVKIGETILNTTTTPPPAPAPAPIPTWKPIETPIENVIIQPKPAPIAPTPAPTPAPAPTPTKNNNMFLLLGLAGAAILFLNKGKKK